MNSLTFIIKVEKKSFQFRHLGVLLVLSISGSFPGRHFVPGRKTHMLQIARSNAFRVFASHILFRYEYYIYF